MTSDNLWRSRRFPGSYPRLRRGGIGAVLWTVLLLFLSTVSHPRAQSTNETWLLRGEAIVTCPCHVPCPCRTNGRPSEPHCENLSYVHIVEGKYHSVSLNHLKYVWAADECRGPSCRRKPTTLYFQQGVTKSQIDAVEKIMDGEEPQEPGAPSMRAKRVPLFAGTYGPHYFVRAASTIRVDVNVAPGPLPMEPLPALDMWGNTVTYARNIHAKIDDPDQGLHWDYSGLQANYRTFETNAEFAAKGLLLGLFRDDSGRFTTEQRLLIHELHLEIPLGREDFDRMLHQVKPEAQAADIPENPIEDKHGSIGGLVMDPEGKPRSGARVQLKTAGSYTQIAVTNPAGRYFFAHAPTGSSELCAFTWDGRNTAAACESVRATRNQILGRDLRLQANQR